MVQILFTVFGMGHIYENAKTIDNHGTLLHTSVDGLFFDTEKHTDDFQIRRLPIEPDLY